MAFNVLNHLATSDASAEYLSAHCASATFLNSELTFIEKRQDDLWRCNANRNESSYESIDRDGTNIESEKDEGESEEEARREMKNVAQIWGIEGRGCNFLRNEANEVSRNCFEGMAFIYVYITVKPHLSKCEMRRYDTIRKACFAKYVYGISM